LETEAVTVSQPTILIIDDDVLLGGNLKRLVARSFADHQVLWTRNAVTGLDLVRLHLASLRLVVLDLDMPLLDGNTAAVQIRTLAPTVPIMPFTAHEESIAALLDMGCVLPLIKQPEQMGQVSELMRQAMVAAVAPMPERPWIAALRQSGASVLSFVAQGQIPGVLAADREAAARVRQALTLLDKYCGRYTTPAREVIKAHKLLHEAGVG
jgi:DNA-binding NtrC family response regulator